MADSGRTSNLSLSELRTWTIAELKLWLEKHGLNMSGVKDALIERVFRAMTEFQDISLSDSNRTSNLPLSELRKWTIAELKLWLEKHGLNMSGVKEALIQRVFRAMAEFQDISSSDDDSLSDRVKALDLSAEHTNIHVDSFLDVFSTELITDNVDIKSDKYQDIFSSFVQNLTVSQEICWNLEKGTRGQHSNLNWKRARSFLITASVMGEVCKRKKTVPDNLIKKLCGYINVPENLKTLKYGRDNESVAIGKYEQDHSKKCHGKVKIKLCGLKVNPKYPYLGASVDGLIMCDKCGNGVVEVKCPYGSDKHETPWRNSLPIKCAEDPKFCCSIHDGRLRLKVNHNYMYQIQGQMAILELDWADFVIWTSKGLHIERVKFSEGFWVDMVAKLKQFYTINVVAELFTRRVKQGKPLY